MTRSAGSFTIAGERVSAAQVEGKLRTYLRPDAKTTKTVRIYDVPDRPMWQPFTMAEVEATRRISSRISNAEAQLLIEASSRIDWHGLAGQAWLADADPCTSAGLELYWQATSVYEQLVFHSQRRGIAVAKRHKLLHQRMRHMVPILDSRLAAKYRRPARELATTLGSEIPELLEPAYEPLREHAPRYKRLTWLAIREDLVRNADALGETRDWLGESGVWERTGMSHESLEQLSDLRVLDILTWTPSTE